MRTIKFRVWDKQVKDWIKEGCAGVSSEGDILTYRSGGLIPGWIRDDNERFKIQQYTGLNLLDGTEIYEGDLVEVEENYDGPHEIIFRFGTFWIGEKWSLHHFFFDNTLKGDIVRGLKIVGNIFE